jgi:hypothetical protein
MAPGRNAPGGMLPVTPLSWRQAVRGRELFGYRRDLCVSTGLHHLISRVSATMAPGRKAPGGMLPVTPLS